MTNKLPNVAPEDIRRLLADLIAIPSVNPELDPAGTGERDVADFAAGWLGQHGVETWLENQGAGRPNAVASVGEADGRTLVFCAHLDTVAARDMSIAPFEPVMKGNRMYGRGSYDMKGGAAAVMAAAAGLAESDVRGRVLVALVADEEYQSAGAVDFVGRHRADACIVTEPSELELVLAHKGFLWLEIETPGQAAHGSRWDLGESAIHKMAPIIEALRRLDRDVLRAREHELTGPASLHCAVISGGSGWSTYADRCMLRVERRTIPGESVDEAFEEIQAHVLSADPDAEVRRVFARSPSWCDPDQAIARCVREGGEAVLGHPPTEVGAAYWMDAAIFTEAGVPTVNLGPSGAGAHAAEEWVDVDSVVACADILMESARRFFE